MLDVGLVAPKASRDVEDMLPDDIDEPLLVLPLLPPMPGLLVVELLPKPELLLDRILPPELLAPLP